MTITPAYLDELRARITLSDVVGRKVTWDPGKSNPGRRDYWACCPFHQEDTPSFHADDRRGRYKCFGCGASGDVVKFVMETDRLSFPEAVERLAAEAGMEPPKRSSEERAKTELRDRLIAAQDAATRFFKLELRRAAGRAAQTYLRDKRGLSEETLDRFALGYAPRDGAALGRFLADNDVAIEDAVAGGLLIKPEDGRAPFARFRDRVMFPIRDGRGRTVAFGGRAMSADAQAKYLNSPETPIFSKGRLLYHFEAARSALGPKGGPLIVVEGYMDVIGLAQAGLDMAVAPLGTAITEDQLQMAWRVTDTVILALDGDAAGARAAGRTLDRALPLLGPEKSLRFAFMPEGEDPDDLVRRAGADAMRERIDAALSASDMLWRVNAEAAGLETPEERAKLKSLLREATERMTSPDLRGAYREAFKARIDALYAEARPGLVGGGGKAPQGRARSTPALSRAVGKARVARARSIALLVGAARAPQMIDAHLEAFAAVDLASDELDRMRDDLLTIRSTAGGVDVAEAVQARWGSRWRDLALEAARAVPWLHDGVDPEAVEAGWREALENSQRTGGLRRGRRTGV